MEFINVLEKYRLNNLSIRKVLNEFGITNWRNTSEFIKNLTEEESIAFILNWLTRVLNKDDIAKVRLRDHYNNDTCEVWLKNKKGGIYVTQLRRN